MESAGDMNWNGVAAGYIDTRYCLLLRWGEMFEFHHLSGRWIRLPMDFDDISSEVIAVGSVQAHDYTSRPSWRRELAVCNNRIS